MGVLAAWGSPLLHLIGLSAGGAWNPTFVMQATRKRLKVIHESRRSRSPLLPL